MPVDAMIGFSNLLKRFIERVGKLGAVFILPLIFVTVWDVVWRKVRALIGETLGYLSDNVSTGFGDAWVWLRDVLFQTLPFQSTVLQELEWHFHTALFTLVLGYTYVNNRHVRVDLIREKLAFRKQAWIEFLGCSLFLIPYCAVTIYFAGHYVYEAYTMNEISASLVGLPHRWVIKSVLLAGLVIAALSAIAVWLQTVLVLFGPKELRFQLMTLEWPEEQSRKERLRARSGL